LHEQGFGPEKLVSLSVAPILTFVRIFRGSQGSWVPIENEQRVRVTSVRGKNIRVLIRSAQPVDWATLRLSLWERPVERTTEQYERGDDARSFSIETRAITEEIDRNSGPLPKTFFVFQADVKLYTIHRSCIFKAEIQTRPDTGELVAFGPEMITHNSGRRDTTDNIKKRPSTTEDMVMLPPSSKRSRPGSDERPYARSSSQASSPTSSTSFVESPVGWQQDDTLVPGNFGSINEIPAPQQTATLPSFSSLMLPARFATLPPLPASLIAPIPRAAPMSHPSPSLLHSSSPSSHADTTDDMDTDETQENMVFMLESLRSKARQYSESSNGPSAFSARISPSTQRRGVGY
jgi:hypothetical protein